MVFLVTWLLLAAVAGVRMVLATQRYADLYRLRSGERWTLPHERGNEFFRAPHRWFADSFRESVHGSRFWRAVSERQPDPDLERARQQVWTRILVAAIALSLAGPMLLISTFLRS
jgi:hypothetical protein